MQKTLIKNEIISSIKDFIIWSIIILLFITLSILLFPLYNNTTIKLPSLLLKILSLDNITSIKTYYATSIEYSIILGSIMASILAFKVILYDYITNYNYYLFTRPISKKKLYINKIIVITLEILIFNIIFNMLSIILLHKHLNIIELLKINSALFLSQITNMSISLMISSFIKKPKHIYPIALLITLVFLLLSIIEKLLDIYLLRYINPFSYFKVSDITLNGTYNISFIVASLFIIIFSISISYREYDSIEL